MNARKIKVQLISVLALLVSILSGDPAVSAERIVIGTPSRGLFEFPAVVAIRKGYYKDEGLDVDKVQMQPAIAVKALISGDIDYLLAWGSAIRAAVTGVPIKAVVGMAKVTRPAYPDPTATGGDWSAVNLAPIKPLRRPVTLRQIKSDPRLKRIQLVRQSRLSVMPMAATDFRAIVLMGR